MKIKILSDIASWKTYRNLEKGKVYDMPPEDAQKLVLQGLAAEVIEEFLGGAVRKRVEAETKRPKPEEKVIDPQTESRLRKIARNQGFDEGVFLKEYVRLIAEGRSDMDALSQTMKLFEKGAKTARKPTLADFAPGQLDVQTLAAGLGAPPGEKPMPPKKAEIDLKLAGWLSEHGFAKNLEGTAYTKIVKVVRE